MTDITELTIKITPDLQLLCDGEEMSSERLAAMHRITEKLTPPNLLALCDALAQRDAQIARMEVELSGADERSKMMFDAKNHWADHARKAEAQLETAKRAIDNLDAERNELRAQLAELAKQEPVAVVRQTTVGRHCTMFAVFPVGTLFYARPAPPAPVKLPARLSPEGYHIDEAYMVEDAEGDYLERDDVIAAIKAAGLEVADE